MNKTKEDKLDDAISVLLKGAITPLEFKIYIKGLKKEYAEPKCDKCFDKGYRTEVKGVRKLSKRESRRGATISDISGEPIDNFTAMIFCDCGRGKELEIRVKEYADRKIKELDKQPKYDGSEHIKHHTENRCVDWCPKCKLSNKDNK